MAKSKKQLQDDVIMAAREYGISTTLFRNAVGQRLGVNVTDMECLALLFFKGISNPTELGAYTGLSSGATTAMLNRLERAGLIIRKPNPHDRRGSLIEVNKDSVAMVGPMFAATREGQDKLVASYSAEELELLSEFFKKFTAVWEEGRRNL
jgi:DNA-binding MarR family transcriptional regulator